MKREANSRSYWRLRLCKIIVASLVIPAFSGAPQAAMRTEAAPLPITQSGTDPVFAALAQRYFLGPLANRKIGGAVIVAVKDGREIYRATIGYADRERRRQVDAERTMFGIASISKTFTATAVAQLVSQGRLRFDDPIDRHLRSFKVALASSRPIRVGELLTHSSGIPERFLGSGCGDSCISLSQFLGDRLPRQRVPSGSFVSYANAGNSVAGQMVADITGATYGTYLRAHIFRPLGMRHSRFDMPGEPAAEAADAIRAKSYELDGDGALVASPTYRSLFSPAGQVVASGADMARYMIAHLEAGSPLLSDAARRDMQIVHGRTPGFPEGFGWGWDVRTVNGTTLIGHGGDLRGVVSDLRMIPSQRIGYFVAVTGDAGSALEQMRLAFRTRFAGPEPFTPAVAAPGLEVDAGLPGTYQDFRFSAPDQLKMLSMFSETKIRRIGPAEVAVDLPSQIGGGTYHFVPVDKDLYRISTGPAERSYSPGTMLRLFRDKGGSIATIAINDNDYMLAAQRLPFYQIMAVKLPLLAAGLLLLLAALAAALVAFFRASRSTAGIWPLVATGLSSLCLFAFAGIVAIKLAGASPWDLLHGLIHLGLAPAYALLWAALSGFVVAAILHATTRLLPPWCRRLNLAAIVAGLSVLLLLGLNGQFHTLY